MCDQERVVTNIGKSSPSVSCGDVHLMQGGPFTALTDRSTLVSAKESVSSVWLLGGILQSRQRAGEQYPPTQKCLLIIGGGGNSLTVWAMSHISVGSAQPGIIGSIKTHAAWKVIKLWVPSSCEVHMAV